jgi:hypothetical protein
MYAGAIPLAPPRRQEFQQSAQPSPQGRPRPPLSALGRPDGNFSTWLAGTVLPALESRVRLDLVPLEGWQDPRVADGEALGFVLRHE